MRDCIELMGDIIAIHLFPEGQLNIDVPFNAQCQSLKSSNIRIGSASISCALLKSQRGLAVDTYYNNVPDGSIIIEAGTSIKETPSNSIQGISYSTKISARTYDDIDGIRTFVDYINNHAFFDTLIVDSMDNVFLLRGVEPATRITMSASLPLHHTQTIDIDVVSVNGIIPVRLE